MESHKVGYSIAFELENARKQTNKTIKQTNKREQQERIKNRGDSVGLEYNGPKRIHNYRIFNIMFCFGLLQMCITGGWAFLAAEEKELDPAIVL